MARELIVALAAACALDLPGNAIARDKDRPTHAAAEAALAYFESFRHADFDVLLRRLRQPAPPPAVRATVIRNLPKEGELTPTAQEASKLEIVWPALTFHGREHDMEFRLITVGGMAFVGLHARTVLLISREALGLLDDKELIAIVAHELGHDYIWQEYEEARGRRDNRRLQELELRCDGLALIALRGQRVHPERLVSAVSRLARYNERAIGIPNDPRYVPLDQRVLFIRAVARLIGTSVEASSNVGIGSRAAEKASNPK